MQLFQWHGLIREAIAIKRCEPERVHDSQLKRMSDLAQLLRFILSEGNRIVRDV